MKSAQNVIKPFHGDHYRSLGMVSACAAGSCVQMGGADNGSLKIGGGTFDPKTGVMSFTPAETTAFLEGLKKGDFDAVFSELAGKK